MNKKITLGAAIAVALMFVAISIPLTMLYARNEQNKLIADIPKRAKQFAVMEEVRQVAQDSYFGNIDLDAVNAETVRGYIAGLGDPHSRYLDAEEYSRYTKRLNGEMSDLGLVAVYEPDRGIVVAGVASGTPAANSGLQKGDIIQKVTADNRVILSALDVNEATSASFLSELSNLRNVASNVTSSQVVVTYKRDDVTKTVSVMIGHNLPSVFGELINETVGHIRITGFYKTTRSQLEEAIKSLQQQYAASFLIDLRGCSEGTVAYALDALDLFVGEGSMATVIYRNGESESFNTSATSLSMSNNIAVLINSTTEGAAELFAYDLNAYTNKKVRLVGMPTAGNNTMQKDFPLQQVNGAVLLTIGTLLPFGGNKKWADGGVKPDLKIGNPENQLQQAVGLLTDGQSPEGS
ncbi:MAG: hypothetical protein LBB67_03195 [Oscillospiraceae bacterium]|nr:hypothetical protein [Oscillospiraceae bacterium]